MFLLGLAGLAIFIFLLNLLQSTIQQWMGDKTHAADNQEASAKDRLDQDQELQEQLVEPVLINRMDAIANAIRAYHKTRDIRDLRRLRNEQITIIALSFAALFAFLTFLAAGISDWIFSGQLDTMREERRAWVGPVSGGFPNGLPQVGTPGTVTVQFHNTGREPALDVLSDLSP
jgi:hypothetical protein